MNSLRVMPFWGWACFALLFGACSKQVAGGSVGTDNPQATAVMSDASGAPVLDSVRVRVWRSDQNPVTEPEPVLDTTIMGTDAMVIRPDSLGLSGKSWNIEAQTKDGRSGLLQDFSTNDSGHVVRNGEVVPDTFSISLQWSGSAIVLDTAIYYDNENRDSSGFMAGDTLEYIKGGVNSPDVVYTPGREDASFFVVLGTSIVIPIGDEGVPSSGSLGLPPGSYTMVTLDSVGTVLLTWRVTILP